MPSSYPGLIDDAAATHADVEDSVLAVQNELGVNPSGAAATVAARFDALPAPTTSASDLTAGTLSADRIAAASLPLGKLDTDVATQAELDAASTADRARANHTGTQPASTVSDLTEVVQDLVGVMVVAGANVTATYDDAAGTVTIASSGGGTTDAEVVRDTMATALVAGANVTITPNDAADTITIAAADTNTTDPEVVRDTIAATLAAGTNITVTADDAADTITVSTTATVNSTDAALRDRTTHTGEQAISTVTGLQTALDSKAAALVTQTQQAAAYTLALADAGTIVETTSASAVTVTVPPNSSVAFPVGTTVVVRQYGAGETTVVAGAGVTIRSRSSAYRLAGQYAEASLVKRGVDEWVLTGDVIV